MSSKEHTLRLLEDTRLAVSAPIREFFFQEMDLCSRTQEVGHQLALLNTVD